MEQDLLNSELSGPKDEDACEFPSPSAEDKSEQLMEVTEGNVNQEVSSKDS